ncbi:MAG: acyl-CoA thioesterase [Litoreibacter sp.]
MTKLRYHTPLLGPELRALAIPEPWSFGMADRTRFGELDTVGHVNNTAYLRWFEAFRVSYLIDYGLANTSADTPFPVLKKIGVEFIAEMNLHEDYIITGRTTTMRTTSAEMEYGVWSSDGELRATGYALLVFLTRHGRYSLTDAQRATLVARDGTIDAR